MRIMWSILILAGGLLVSGAARADCSTPTGVAGDQIYNSTYDVMQYCNGANWVNMGADSGSGTVGSGNQYELAYYASSGTAVSGLATMTTNANGGLNVAGATITTSSPVLNLTQTWNSGGVTFTAIKANITNTASAAASLLMDLQVGGSSQFAVNRSGVITTLGGLTLTGDATASGTTATTVVKVNGVSYAASPSTDTVPVITASNTATYTAIPDCDDTGGNHLNYDTGTHAFSCGTSGGGSSGITVASTTITSGTNTYVLYNNSGVVGEYAISGSGSVAMTASPTFTTPTLGVASASSLAVTSSTASGNGFYLPAASTLGWSIGGTGEVQLTGSALSPVTSDGNALGTSSLMWSDLFLASGSVINFNNGDVTITHSANDINVAGGTLSIGGSNVLVASDIGSSVQAYDADLGVLAGLTFADDQVILGTGAATAAMKSIPDCDDTGGNHLNYDTTTNAFSCGTSSSGGGGGITGPGSSTDNAIARWDGTGGDTLQNSGITIDDSNNVTGIGTLNASGAVTFSNYTGNGIVQTSGGGGAISVGNLSGDVTTSGSLAATVVKVNGIAYSATAAADTIPVITTANTTATYTAIPDCDDTGGNHLNYDTGTHAFSCGTSGGGSSGITIGSTTITSGTNTKVLYNNSGVVGEYTVSGSGSVAMTTSPTFTTPTLGAASATTLASGAVTITSSSATALAVGANGTTNPALTVDASTASSATGISITGAAATGRAALAVTSSGTNEGLSIDAKGSGTIRLGATSTGAVEFSRNAVPTASDGAALGTSSLMWSDLFLASGAVVNFDAGDVLITHSADTLNVTGGALQVGGSAVLVSSAIGSTIQGYDADLATLAALTFADDQVILGTGAGTAAMTSIPDCDDSSGNHLNYDTTTNAFSCGTSSSGGGGSTTFDAIGDAVATGQVDNAAYAQTWTWNSLTTGTGLTISSSSMTTGSLLALTNTYSTSSTGAVLNVTTSTPGASFAIKATAGGTANTGYAVYGTNTATSGANYGVYGRVASTNNSAAAVRGENAATSGTGYGVYGSSVSTDTGSTTSGPAGVWGANTGSNNGGAGVYGTNNQYLGYGVWGYNSYSGSSGGATGVYGLSASSVGYGVYGKNSSTGWGVYSDGPLGVKAGSYINFGTTKGTSGYGIFDNSGTLQYKNSGGSWTNLGGLAGPGSSTDNAVARFDGTGGSTLQNSGVLIDDSNNITGVVDLAATTVTLSSDIRLKEQIAPLEGSLDKLAQLRGVSYKWKPERVAKGASSREQMGVIAQEVEKVFPDAVATQKDGFLSVNYPSLIAPVIEAIKELADRFAGLGTRMDERDAEIKALQARVEKLEAMLQAKGQGAH